MCRVSCIPIHALNNSNNVPGKSLSKEKAQNIDHETEQIVLVANGIRRNKCSICHKIIWGENVKGVKFKFFFRPSSKLKINSALLKYGTGRVPEEGDGDARGVEQEDEGGGACQEGTPSKAPPPQKAGTYVIKENIQIY